MDDGVCMVGVGFGYTNIVNYFHPGSMYGGDKTKLRYPQSKHSILKMRSPPTIPAMSIPILKSFLSPHLTREKKKRRRRTRQ